jgi:pyridoxine 4-dehydrogenase
MSRAGTIRLGSRQVDRMGFGAMQLPGPGVFGPPRDPEQARAVLRRVAEVGIDHIDTAQFYGPNVANELIREVMYPYAAGLALVSKVGARRDSTGGWQAAQTPDELKAAVEENLSTLGVDRLAAVNLRRHDDGGADFDAQLEAMITMRDERLFDGIGLSNVTLEYLNRAVTRTEIACVQNAYNLADRSSEPVLNRCEELGIAFVPFFPLGSAFSTDNPVLGHPGVRKTADRLSATEAQVALAWLLARSACIALIPGTSSVRHLEENCGSADIELDEEAISDIR